MIKRFEDFMNEKKESFSDKFKPKKGKMHKLLGLKEGEKVIDAFETGKELYDALMKATNNDKKEVIGLLAFVAQINPERNIFDDALKLVKKDKVEEQVEVILEAKADKSFIVKVQSSRNGRDRTTYVVGTLADMIKYFGYTLEIGHSWNKKINMDPKTPKAFIKALQDSYSEKEAAIYNRTFVDIVNEIPEGTSPADISDQTKKD